MSGWTLREATEADLPALLELHQDYHRELQSFGMPYDLKPGGLEEALRLRIRSRLILTAVAQGEDGGLAGFVVCSILRLANEYLCEDCGSVGYLNDLYVIPALRRQGLALKLTGMAEDWLREREIPTMQLQVLQNNPAAHRYWQRVGMGPVGTLYDKKLVK